MHARVNQGRGDGVTDEAENTGLDAWVARIDDALRDDDLAAAVGWAGELHPAELADVLEALPPAERSRLWAAIPDPAVRGELLIESHRQVREGLIEHAPAAALAEAVSCLELDELADLYDRLPAEVIDAVQRAMDELRRERLARVLSWPHDTAGGLMDADAVAIREDITLAVAQRYLRRVHDRDGALPEHTEQLVVIDHQNRYRGVLPLSDLLTRDPELTVAEVMDRDIEPLRADMPASRVARLFEDRDLVSAPVVDDHGLLIGRITVDDVVDVIRSQAERSVMGSAGLDRNVDMFAPVTRAVRQRGLWLSVNLINAFAASWVIGLFGATIEQRVALAILMPVVASMGGVAGIQTLTLVTRALALGQIGRRNAGRLLLHELGVCLLAGVGLALVLGLVALVWFQDAALGAVFGIAVLANLTNAALAGTLVPLLLHRAGIDPAVAGGVVLTALTDIVGFAAFLGLATLFLLA